MTTRYQEKHYEDVARLLSRRRTAVKYEHGSDIKFGVEDITHDFADLFAADNPPNDYCGYCSIQPPFHVPCTEKEEHAIYHYQGFNRKQFLEACAIEITP